MHGDKQTNDSGLAWWWSAGMAVVAGLIRLIPHPWNFTPVGALGLFGGARLRSWWAAVLPVSVMVVSDLLLWWARGNRPFNPWVYGCFLLTVLWGWLFLRAGSAWRVGAVSVLVSVQFFLVTNFGVWLASSADPQAVPEGAAIAYKDVPGLPFPVPSGYARNLSGLGACYFAALRQRGQIAATGPFTDGSGALIIYEAASAEEAEKLLQGDPFHTGGIFLEYALRPWNPVMANRELFPA
jgi:YCII-related domain